MRRVVDRGLVALALRRSLFQPGVVAWTLALVGLVLLSGRASDTEWMLERADTTFAAAQAGLARESAWLAFVLGVAPLIVLRAVTAASPWRTSTGHDAPWLATRAVSNLAIASSTWLGVTIAGTVLMLPFAVLSEVRGGKHEAPVAAGTLAGPDGRWAATGAPLAWRAEVPEALARDPLEQARTSARIQLGLGAGAGIAAEVELHVRRASADGSSAEAVARARIGNRGTIEVRLPAGQGAVDLEIVCSGEGSRVYVLSERVELWSHGEGLHAATLSIVTRLVLAIAAWLAIALGFSRFVSPATAAAAVLAAWVPHWWAEDGPVAFASRWIPGADLFDALATVGEGRAPAPVGIELIAGTCALVVLGVALACLGLRTWRVSR